MDWTKKITQTKTWVTVMDLVSLIHWPRTVAVFNRGIYFALKEEDHDQLRQRLKTDYYVILTRRKSHLSTHLISLGTWILSRRFSHYSHVLVNVEGDLEGHIGFKLLEATGAKGVSYSTFMEVFDCDSVALLVPTGVTPEEWTSVLDTAKNSLGKPYDSLFDIASDKRMSCVEVILWGLKKLPNYEQRFPKLLELIEDADNLTPQMFYDSGEFDIVYEVRR